jgi:signal recognition particle subunit SRP19
MRKLQNRIIVWPTYFDASKTQREGRRLPKKLCVASPKIEEVVKAAEILGLNPQPNFKARFPSAWWIEEGYVIVDKAESKSNTLRKIAKKILEFRNEAKR